MDGAEAGHIRAIRSADGLIAALGAAIGRDAVLTGHADLRFYSEDIFRAGLLPVAVVQPATIEEVQKCAAICYAADAPMVPRGGGLSYSDGYLPAQAGSVTFDTSKINKIIAIHADDMYVTVEAGCTWSMLDEALRPLGLRTAYWGPVSGLQATVGGALSQNSVFWGAVHYGTAAQNVLGLDIVLADGTLLGTGSHAARADLPPFFRHYGPEMAGLFTGDCGAFGLKVRVSLPLMPRPAVRSALSFGYGSAPAALAGMAQMARAGAITEGMLFDRGHSAAKLSPRIPVRQMLQSFKDVARSDGLGAALQMALHGKRFLQDVEFSVHLLLEAPTRAEMQRHMGKIRSIAAVTGGWPIQATIGRVLSARPFPEPSLMLAPSRFLPVNGIVPHSIAPAVYQGVQAIFAKHQAATKELGVRTGIFSTAMGYGAMLIEATCHWDAAFLESHGRLYKRDMAAFANLPARPEALALVTEIRRDLCNLFVEHGATHLQIGKTYPYRETRSAASWEMLQAVKRLLDPKGLMNPGALGLMP